MEIIDYKDIDFVNYKRPSMYVIMPHCTFKCDVECGRPLCQNHELAHAPTHTVRADELVSIFDSNPVSEAVVFGGLEPFDSAEDLLNFLINFRYSHSQPVVIYTGYTKEEIQKKFDWIYLYENIVIKYGRFVPDQESHYDEVLGVTLASPNQYAEEINFD